MRPSEKEQLIKAIMEVPDVNQREKLLNGLIATENKFIANEQHAWREMAENMQGAKRGCCPMCPRMGKDGMCPMMEDRKCPKMEREGRREREREGMRGHERPEEGKCPKMKDKDEDDDD
jgi:hypothetical protein